jgi:hypothetical protein
MRTGCWEEYFKVFGEKQVKVHQLLNSETFRLHRRTALPQDFQHTLKTKYFDTERLNTHKKLLTIQGIR